MILKVPSNPDSVFVFSLKKKMLYEVTSWCCTGWLLQGFRPADRLVVTAWVGMEHGENGRFAVGLTGILRVGRISQDGLAEDSRNFKGPSLCPVVSPC